MNAAPASRRALILAAPGSGSGKTVLQLALLRALSNAGVHISAAKAGPDFIDPGFHTLACGEASVNLDPWAMPERRIQNLISRQNGDHLLIEAMMGLYDGAADGTGSAADLAMMIGAPVLLVVDAAKQSHSVAALVRGFRDHRQGLNLCGVIFNKVGSERHEAMLEAALDEIDVPVFGAVPRSPDLALPERHLGLVLAGELEAPEAFIEQAAALVTECCNLDAIQQQFGGIGMPETEAPQLPPLGNRIAIARDAAFAFAYPHLIDDWREQGSELSFFSPLENEAPDASCDAVFLPGGYPELYPGRLAAAEKFKAGLKAARDRNCLIYGECGGYMVLGEGLIDADGSAHEMTGLLKLDTSFSQRKLHLGYRRLTATGFVLGDALVAHEFHYTTAVREEGEPLFHAHDALGTALGTAGLRAGQVMGSYMHVIDRRQA